MGNADNAPARSGLGWFPKLFLWTSVIAFGYLYLSSLDRKSPEEGAASPAVASQAASQIDKVLSAMRAKLSGSPVGEAKTEGGEAETVVTPPAPATTPAPVNATEAAVFANSLMAEPGTKEEKPAPKSAAALPASAPMAETVVKEDKPVPESTPSVVSHETNPPQMPEPVTVETLQPPVAAETATVSKVAPSSEQVSQEPPIVHRQGARPLPQETMAQYRARMMAEYEAMRRAADSQRRQYWSRMPVPTPVPYPYPGPATGYGPAYPPGPYTPRQ